MQYIVAEQGESREELSGENRGSIPRSLTVAALIEVSYADVRCASLISVF